MIEPRAEDTDDNLHCRLQLEVTAPLYQLPPAFLRQLQRRTDSISYWQAKKSEAWQVSFAIKHSATLWDILRFYGLFLQIPLSLPAAALSSSRELKAFLSFTGLIVSLARSFIVLISIFLIYLTKKFLIRLTLEERWPHKRQLVLSIWSQRVFCYLWKLIML